ncbi:NAD(P)H dehydrogenase (quinone) [Ranunculus cassubicifolius]
MGKGGGCVPSKKRAPLVADDAPHTPKEDGIGSSTPAPTTTAAAAPAPIQETEPSSTPIESLPKSTPQNLKIFIIFYSMYGHVEGLAKKMKKGVDGVEGIEGVLYRVPETLSNEVLEKMHAPPKDDSIPEITSAELTKADGILFGFPTRYGAMAAQMKSFFDSTGGLWKEQKLAGKPAGFFVSTGTQGGGQETTAWTAITQLTHHGMLFVPIGYTFGAGMFTMDSIRGGSPYGAGVFAGDGTRQASETELALAEHQGNYMADIVKKLCLA